MKSAFCCPAVWPCLFGFAEAMVQLFSCLLAVLFASCSGVFVCPDRDKSSTAMCPGGDGGGGDKKPPWKVPVFDGLPPDEGDDEWEQDWEEDEWGEPQRLLVAGLNNWPAAVPFPDVAPGVRYCKYGCKKMSLLRKKACANPACHLFYMKKQHANGSLDTSWILQKGKKDCLLCCLLWYLLGCVFFCVFVAFCFCLL